MLTEWTGAPIVGTCAVKVTPSLALAMLPPIDGDRLEGHVGGRRRDRVDLGPIGAAVRRPERERGRDGVEHLPVRLGDRDRPDVRIDPAPEERPGRSAVGGLEPAYALRRRE